VSFCPPNWLTVILGLKGKKTARKRHGTCTLWPKNINGNLIRCHLQGFGKKSTGFEKVYPGAENRVLLTKMARNGHFSRSHKIRNRLALRPTLVVLCLKLWSVPGGATVRVTKCVILSFGMVDSNSRLERQRNGL
jgi:hypothetical protein